LTSCADETADGSDSIHDLTTDAIKPAEEDEEEVEEKEFLLFAFWPSATKLTD
jgi:hypothetical protein